MDQIWKIYLGLVVVLVSFALSTLITAAAAPAPAAKTRPPAKPPQAGGAKVVTP